MRPRRKQVCTQEPRTGFWGGAGRDQAHLPPRQLLSLSAYVEFSASTATEQHDRLLSSPTRRRYLPRQLARELVPVQPADWSRCPEGLQPTAWPAISNRGRPLAE